MEDFAGPDDSLQDKLKIAKSCFYQGRKYPPNHPLKYQHREDYWFNLATKFLIVVIFEVSLTKRLRLESIIHTTFCDSARYGHLEGVCGVRHPWRTVLREAASDKPREKAEKSENGHA